MASLLAAAPSELANHSEQIVDPSRLEETEDTWAFAGADESVESFLAACPPSTTMKSWISTQHDGRKQLLEKYYAEILGAENNYESEQKFDIVAAWDELETKSLETLTATLRTQGNGKGKWMIFVQAADVDALWAKIVTALWDGKLGHTAKVSGCKGGSHVVYVYVDPFWEVIEVERVLSALRSECGVDDPIKYKADGVSHLNLSKDNAFGIPPSLYSAARESLTATVQTNTRTAKTDTRQWCKNGIYCKHLKQGRCSYLHSEEDQEAIWRRPEPELDADGMQVQKSKGRSSRAPQSDQPKLAPAKEKTKATGGGFAALAGFDDDDSAAILEKKLRKAKKKAEKKAAADALVAETAKASFEELKASLASGGGNWGDEEDDEPMEDAAVEAVEEDDDDDDDDEEEENEEEEEEAPAPAVTHEQPVENGKERRAKKVDAAQEEAQSEVDRLLAELETSTSKKEDAPEGMSKAAAKRAAKKKAASAGAPVAVEGAEAASTADSSEAVHQEEGGATKSAADVKEMMKTRAAEMKKKNEAKKSGGSAAAVAAAAAEAKARDGGKKKDSKPQWQGSGNNRGMKARGSDNKYQGE